MKIEIDGFITAWHYGDPNGELTDFSFSETEPDGEYRCVITPHTIEVEVEIPDSTVVTAQIIEGLRKAKQQAYEAAAQTAADCEDKIQQLLALTNEVHND